MVRHLDVQQDSFAAGSRGDHASTVHKTQAYKVSTIYTSSTSPAVIFMSIREAPQSSGAKSTSFQVPGINSEELEKQPITPATEKLDIEHALVQDDPRDWSHHRKVVLFIQRLTINC